MILSGKALSPHLPVLCDLLHVCKHVRCLLRSLGGNLKPCPSHSSVSVRFFSFPLCTGHTLLFLFVSHSFVEKYILGIVVLLDDHATGSFLFVPVCFVTWPGYFSEVRLLQLSPQC